MSLSWRCRIGKAVERISSHVRVLKTEVRVREEFQTEVSQLCIGLVLPLEVIMIHSTIMKET